MNADCLSLSPGDDCMQDEGDSLDLLSQSSIQFYFCDHAFQIRQSASLNMNLRHWTEKK